MVAALQCQHTNPLRRKQIMNLSKHMEAVLVCAFGVIAATGLATAAVPVHHAAHSAVVAPAASVVITTPMQVVTIVGKRQSRS